MPCGRIIYNPKPFRRFFRLRLSSRSKAASFHLYWYGYEAVRLWGIDIGVVDRVLVNFDRTAGLFHHILYTKLFALLLLALSCLGTKGVKEEKITWGRIWTVLAAGLALFFLNWWMLSLPLPVEANVAFYAASMAAGYV